METSALHLAKLKLAISPKVGGSGAQFLVVGDCVRASPYECQMYTCTLSYVGRLILKVVWYVPNFVPTRCNCKFLVLEHVLCFHYSPH